MANNDRETNDRTTIARGEAGRPAPIDLDGKGTQVRRGNALATLKVTDGPGAGTSHPIFPGDNAIGRSPQNRVQLAFGDDAIHREGHAWIHAQGGGFVIEHGGKPNAVYVNGEKISGRHPLKHGDQIKLGATTLRLDPV